MNDLAPSEQWLENRIYGEIKVGDHRGARDHILPLAWAISF